MQQRVCQPFTSSGSSSSRAASSSSWNPALAGCSSGINRSILMHRSRTGTNSPDVRVRSVHRDLTADVLENVAALALKTRLKESRAVQASVSCDTWSLLSGRVHGAKIYGEGWRSPLNLTAQVLEASVGETTIDTTAIIFRQNIELTNVPVGTCRVVFDRVDFGNFLVHPLMTAAAATAVQGHAFAFDQSSVRISPPTPSARGGVVEFTGTWRGDNQRYQVRLLPVTQGASTGRGVQAHAVPLSIGGRASSALIVEDHLTKFFNGLMLDLQGAELTFMSLNIIPGAGFAGGMADLVLRLELKKFPPMHMQF